MSKPVKRLWSLVPLVLTLPGAGFGEQEQTLEEVVIVGTQIKGADIEGALPVTVVSSDDIDARGVTSGAELLRSIPQVGAIGFSDVRGGITGVNAARGDVASFNLRSLGEGNTLVLVNGRRAVLHPITQTSAVDSIPVATSNANALPTAALKRVEVLRDGASALYGADAVAGVINYVVDDTYEGSKISLRAGAEQGTSRDDFRIRGVKGIRFNDDASHLVVSASYARRNGILATENDFTADSDLRSRAPEFASDTSLDQRSSLEVTPLLAYDGLGTFHLRPTDLLRDNGSTLSTADCGGNGISGSDAVLNDGVQDLCLDAGNHDRALRPNRNEVRTLVSDMERLNLFAHASHEISDTLELYGEASYYRSVTNRQWEQASILSNGRFFVPADYYYNPLGPVTFSDGRVNPNRLPGLDPAVVPVEGLGFELLSLRPVDVGTRNIEVTGDSYRFLTGVRGTWEDWDYDSAVLYSAAKVEDKASNRISTPLLQAQLSLDTPDAYNIFTGVNPNNPASILDATVNPRASIDPFIVSAAREAKTSLALVDFRVSNPAVFEMPAGDAGLGLGLEWRRETLDEDNDSIFDGSTPYVDPLDTSLAPGDITNLSSLQGSSFRPDFDGDRTVASAYAELLLPLLADLPGAYRLDAQIAVRYEDFDDFGNITRPKLALSWYPLESLQFRGAYSEGFRAPNLVQLNSPSQSITTSVQDYAEGIVLGTGNINAGPANGNYILQTSGNPDLDPEKSENLNFGVVWTPVESLTLTADWWQIKTTGTVGVLSDENQSRLDAVLRAQGSFNPNVVRAAPDASNPLGEILVINRQFMNLNERKVEGFDLGIFYQFDTSIGGFRADINGARLLNFDQEAGNEAAQLVSFGADPTVLGSSVGSLIRREFFPKWRITSSLRWNSHDDLWSAALFYRYVSSVIEPTVEVNNEFLEVDSHDTVDFSLSRRDLFVEGTDVRLGINNLFDEEPPLASEAYGFEGELHSSRGRYLFLSVSREFD